MILTCLRCRCEFDAWRARQKFCSQDCHDLSRVLVDAEKLKVLVIDGLPKARIARELGVSWMTVRRAIARYGFEQLWRRQRYA